MGLAKRQSEQDNTKKQRLSPYDRMLLRYSQLADGIERSCPELMAALTDEDKPLLKLMFKRMEHGGFLVVCERENELIEQVFMTGGEDVIDAMIMADKKLKKDPWKLQEPYRP